MSDANAPTLKLRIAMPSNQWGRDCYTIAQKIVDAANVASVCSEGDVELLASKWGRSPTEWNKTGASWGRERLTPTERGYVDGLRDSDPSGAVLRLLAIIERVTTS